MIDHRFSSGNSLRPCLKTRADAPERRLLRWFFQEILQVEQVVDATEIQASNLDGELISGASDRVWIAIMSRDLGGKDNESYKSESVCLMKMCIEDYKSLFIAGIDDRWAGMFMGLLAERLHHLNCQEGVRFELLLDLVSAPNEEHIVGFEISFSDEGGPASCQEQLDRHTLLRMSFPLRQEVLSAWLEGISDISATKNNDVLEGCINRLIPITKFIATQEGGNETIRIPIGLLNSSDKGWFFRIGSFEFKSRITDLGLMVKGGGLR